MMRIVFAMLAATLLLGTSTESTALSPQFQSKILGNSLDPETGAPQEIAGFQSSFSAWTIRKGTVQIFPLGKSGDSVLIARVKGLVLDPAGFNPSPDFEARVVCHDDAGSPFLAVTTNAAPLTPGTPGGSPGGDGILVDVIRFPEECFAPIILFGGDSDGPGPPGFFAVSSF